jgi:multiple sugar transport system substrate-binding protein
MTGRRKILKVVVLMLFMFSLLFFLGSGNKGDDEDETPVKKEKKVKEITLTVAVLSGVHKDPFLATAPKFKEMHPEVTINVVEYPFSDIYEKLMLESTSHSGAIDIFELANGWVPDFAEGNFILPLDDYFAKKDPWLDDIFPAFKGLMKYNNKYYVLLLDGDVFMTYVRKDLFEDPKEKSAFKRKYGYELKMPETWDQFADMSEFFVRDTDGDGENDLFGSAFMLGRIHGAFTFMQFLHSFGGSYFDPDTMKPGVNSKEAMNGYKMIERLLKSGPPDGAAWNYTEMHNAFLHGDIAMMVEWNEATFEIWEESRVKDKILYGPAPGVMIGGKLHRPALQAWGWCAAISSDSKNPDMAYEYLHFNASPKVSLEDFAIPINGLEPWRASHFSDEAIELWSELTPAAPNMLNAMKESGKNGVSDLRIPGMFEYYDAVAIEFGLALTGQKDPQDALDSAAEEWDKITERRGKEDQKRAYQGIFGN